MVLVFYKLGINLMAKRILGWEDVNRYEVSTGIIWCSLFCCLRHPNSILIAEHHDLQFHSIAHDTIKNKDIILREIAGG